VIMVVEKVAWWCEWEELSRIGTLSKIRDRMGRDCCYIELINDLLV